MVDGAPRNIVEGLLRAYKLGAFPMAEPPRRVRASKATGGGRAALRPGPILWYSPDPRAIIPLDDEGGGVHISRSLARTLRRVMRGQSFQLTTDRAFDQVIAACADPGEAVGIDRRHESWIDDRIIDAYCELHAAGHAHSIEAWSVEPGTPTLLGGLYGVHIGGAFFAESMFCRPSLGGTDASKVCLIALVRHLQARGFALLDAQIANEHTRRFNVIEIPRDEYLARLGAAVALHRTWLDDGSAGLASFDLPPAR